MATVSKDYEKLTPLRQQIIDQVLDNLDKGTGIWQPGWRMMGAPCSAITGKKYKGVNNFCLTLTAMANSYKDNRWLTFNQMKDMGWHFKMDEYGKSKAQGKGVPLEFFTLKDKKTRRDFKEASVKGMSNEEREKYIKENVYTVRNYFTVFNGDLIEGIPPLPEEKFDMDRVISKAEELITYWGKNEARIYYGGDESYYKISDDTIHIPTRDTFYNMNEFYSTIFHEIAHSTGHESRLNRKLKNTFKDQEYAKEELRAEIASIFLEQEMNVPIGDKALKNNSAYIQSWKNYIGEDPYAFFKTISDADKICSYVLEKEYMEKLEPYSLISLGEDIYQVVLVDDYGVTKMAFDGAEIKGLHELEKSLNMLQSSEEFKDRTLHMVDLEVLGEISIDRAEAHAKELLKEIEKRPSYFASVAKSPPRKVDMQGKGYESLERMSDKDLVLKGFEQYGGERFKKLYEGESIYDDEYLDERSLITRIAALATEGIDQIYRVFKSSGQFREDKSNTYYTLAIEADQFVSKLKEDQAKSNAIRNPASSFGKGYYNSKG